MNTHKKESPNLSQSSALEPTDNGVSQRAYDIARQNREYKSETQETTVSLKIPISMTEKLRKLGSFLGLSTENILHSSIQYVISYVEIKKIEISTISSYSTFQEGDKYKNVSLELTGKVFEKLQQQKLLDSASSCAVLGSQILYSQLIENEIDFDRVG